MLKFKRKTFPLEPANEDLLGHRAVHWGANCLSCGCSSELLSRLGGIKQGNGPWLISKRMVGRDGWGHQKARNGGLD